MHEVLDVHGGLSAPFIKVVSQGSGNRLFGLWMWRWVPARH